MNNYTVFQLTYNSDRSPSVLRLVCTLPAYTRGACVTGIWDLQFNAGSEGHSWGRFIPVSYTHLDVYKRQAMVTAVVIRSSNSVFVN